MIDPNNPESWDLTENLLTQLQTYHRLLLQWQPKINLVSPTTISNAWARHFYDSIQILDYLPENANNLADLGSGAGFPGLASAILRPDLHITCIESDRRKCLFLQTVARETRISDRITVLNQRIETEVAQKFDIITARALAALDMLFTYAAPLSHDKTIFIFPKGQSWQEEVEIAQKSWNFNILDHSSAVNPNSKILVISDLTRK